MDDYWRSRQEAPSQDEPPAGVLLAVAHKEEDIQEVPDSEDSMLNGEMFWDPPVQGEIKD